MSAATIDDVKTFFCGMSLRLHKGLDQIFDKHALRMKFGVAAPFVEEYERDREYLGGLTLSQYVEARCRDEGLLREVEQHVRIDSLSQWDSAIALALGSYEKQLVAA